MATGRRAAITTAAACVVLGLLTTLAAAWAGQLLFIRSAPTPQTMARVDRDGGVWMAAQWRGLGRRTFVVSCLGRYPPGQERGEGDRGDFPGWVPFPAGAQPGLEVRAWGFGWPMLALRSELRTDRSVAPPVETRRGGLGLIPQRFSRRPYPMGLSAIPIWPGFAVNTAAFAALWALPLAAWPLVRARRRARRGLCPACGYGLAGAAVCPECGPAAR